MSASREQARRGVHAEPRPAGFDTALRLRRASTLRGNHGRAGSALAGPHYTCGPSLGLAAPFNRLPAAARDARRRLQAPDRRRRAGRVRAGGGAGAAASAGRSGGPCGGVSDSAAGNSRGRGRAAGGAAAEPPEKNAAPLAPHCAVCCSIPHVCVGTELGYNSAGTKPPPPPHFFL